MDKKDEALKLAREMLIDNREYVQLHERPSYLALYDKAIARVEAAMEEQPAQQSSKPLTDEEIKELYGDDDNFRMTKKYVVAFARAIEAAHGIKGDE